jgi:hypothetical protein
MRLAIYQLIHRTMIAARNLNSGNKLPKVAPMGIEPMTFRLLGERSTKLSYGASSGNLK